MSWVLTFSRTYPVYHPKKGSPTYFVEKIYRGIQFLGLKPPLNVDLDYDFRKSLIPISEYPPKYHTVRSGNRWKPGDKFSPRVW